eukprot:scaffold590_cov383-Prasinococcus_capsulatus_cf.AAC.13
MPYTYTTVEALNEHLQTLSYVSGAQASKDDLAVYGAISAAPDAAALPNAARWYNHISSLLGDNFPGAPEGVVIGGKAPGGGKAEKKQQQKPKKEEKKVDPEEAKKKKLKAVLKEGGKKGQDIIGAAEMGGLEFFCTAFDEPEGNVEYLQLAMGAANKPVDPEGEERRGGSGEVGKMLFSAGVEALAIGGYVPADKVGKVAVKEWMEAVLAAVGTGAIVGEPTATECYAVCKLDADKGHFPLKMKDSALQAAINFLRGKGCFPEDAGDSDDDDVAYGDDAFEELAARTPHHVVARGAVDARALAPVALVHALGELRPAAVQAHVLDRLAQQVVPHVLQAEALGLRQNLGQQRLPGRQRAQPDALARRRELRAAVRAVAPGRLGRWACAHSPRSRQRAADRDPGHQEPTRPQQNALRHAVRHIPRPISSYQSEQSPFLSYSSQSLYTSLKW